MIPGLYLQGFSDFSKTQLGTLLGVAGPLLTFAADGDHPKEEEGTQLKTEAHQAQECVRVSQELPDEVEDIAAKDYEDSDTDDLSDFHSASLW